MVSRRDSGRMMIDETAERFLKFLRERIFSFLVRENGSFIIQLDDVLGELSRKVRESSNNGTTNYLFSRFFFFFFFLISKIDSFFESVEQIDEWNFPIAEKFYSKQWIFLMKERKKSLIPLIPREREKKKIR